jgi:putative hydrolase of the HAD superfamily
VVADYVVTFDMDDTLFSERDYVRSGFEAVALHLESVVGFDAQRVAGFLWAEFESGVRGIAFDRLMAKWPELARAVDVEALVDAYRRHNPDIKLRDGMNALLTELASAGVLLSLISDGQPDVQKRKYSALGLEQWFSNPVFTGDLGPAFSKPHRRGFLVVQAWSGRPPSAHTYVADNPMKDFAPANQCGWRTIRLRMPDQLHQQLEPSGPLEAPAWEATTLPQLATLLRKG